MHSIVSSRKTYGILDRQQIYSILDKLHMSLIGILSILKYIQMSNYFGQSKYALYVTNPANLHAQG